MKISLINGSSIKEGCTYTVLKEVQQSLEEEIETKMLFIENKVIPECIICRKCKSLDKCIIDDVVNKFVDKAKNTNDFVFDSPVYFAIQMKDYLLL